MRCLAGDGRPADRLDPGCSEILSVGVGATEDIREILRADRGVRDEFRRKLVRRRGVIVEGDILVYGTPLREKTLRVVELEACAGDEWVDPWRLRREVQLGSTDIEVEADARGWWTTRAGTL